MSAVTVKQNRYTEQHHDNEISRRIVQKSTDSKIGMLYLQPSDTEDLRKVRSLTVW